MSNQHYALCGAFDRHNYGDILFPLLHGRFIRSQLGESADIAYYAVKSADLQDVGGVSAESMRTLYARIESRPERQQVIFCGGDILSADWITMLGHHLSSDILCRGLASTRKLLGFQRANEWLRLVCHQPSTFPYVMDPEEKVGGIHYTGVGASGFNMRDNSGHLHAVAELLAQVEGLSVRDQTAVDQLAAVGVKARLVPDTALIMSDTYPADELARLAWRERLDTRHGFDSEKYVVFQAARSYLVGERERVIQQLVELYEMTGLSILLLPIGRATGHSDGQVLLSLFRELDRRDIPCAIQNSPHVLHIMASLAFSCGYIGTSLHGAISTYAFGHKVCGIATRKVKKLDAFLNTWVDPEDAVSVKDLSFLEPFRELMTSGTSLSQKGFDNLATQKGMVYGDMRRYLAENANDI